MVSYNCYSIIINCMVKNVFFDIKKLWFFFLLLFKKVYFEIMVLLVYLSSLIYYECNLFY